MADNFTAEQVSSAGEIFATDQDSGSSAHYPIGKIAWGALNTFNVTDSVSPFPVRLYGHSSINPVFVGNDSNNPIIIRNAQSAAAQFVALTTVSSYGQYSDDSNSALRVSVAAGGNDSASPVFVGNNSATPAWFKTVTDTANPMVVRGVGSSAVTVSQEAGSSFQVTHPGLTALDSAINSSNEVFVKLRAIDSQWTGYDASNSALRVAVTNDSSYPVYVASDTDSPVFVRQVTTLNVAETAATASAGSLTAFTASVSSSATAVATAATRLYGYYITNPSTSAFVYLKVYDDTGDATLGTDAAKMDLGIPPEGAANLSLSPGVGMSSGIALAASGAGGPTDHSSPDASLVVTVWHA